MMFFNPLFLQSSSEAGVQTASSNNKLSNSKYLFSDIIKVFNESDPTVINTVLPESTSLSDSPEIFSFQSADNSAKINYQNQSTEEGNKDQSILEFFSAILLANISPVETLQKNDGSLNSTKENSDVEAGSTSGLKEFVVPSEILPLLLNQLAAADSANGLADATGKASEISTPNGKNNLEVLVSGLMEKLQQEGEITIQLESAGKNIQFKISKMDEVDISKSEKVDSIFKAVQADAPLSDNVEALELSTNFIKSTQTSLNEVVNVTTEESSGSVETAKQKVLKQNDSTPVTAKLNYEEVKNITNKSTLQSGSIDSELDRLIMQAKVSEADLPVVDVASVKTNPTLNLAGTEQSSGKSTEAGSKLQSAASEIKSTETVLQTQPVEVEANKADLSSKVEKPSVQQNEVKVSAGAESTKQEVISGKPQAQTSKTETQPNKTETQTSKPEVQSGKTEVLLDKAEMQSNKPETQTSKTELQSSKPEVQTSKTEAQPKNTEVSASKPEVHPGKAEVFLDKAELQSSKPEVQTSKTEAQSKNTEAQSSKPEVQPGKAEVLLDKAELLSSKPETQTSKTEAQSKNTEAQSSKPEVQSGKTEVLLNKTELQSSKPETQTSKTAVQSNNTEVSASKPEVQPGKTEVLLDKTELQSSKPEAQTSKTEAQPKNTEAQTSKPEVQPGKTEVLLNKTELQSSKPETQTSKTAVQSNNSEVSASKPEVQPGKTEVLLDKAELQANKPETQTSKTELQSSKPEAQTSKTAVQSNNSEVSASKPEVQPGKTEVLLDKAEMQSNKPEAQTSKTEVQPNKTELQPSKTEVHQNKPVVGQSKSAHVSAKVEVKSDTTGLQIKGDKANPHQPEAQERKVFNSQLNLNSENVIRAFEVESEAVAMPKNLNNYKIVVQVGEKKEILSTSNNNVNEVTVKPSPTLTNAVSIGEAKNLTEAKTTSSHSVKTIIDSIKQVLQKETSISADNVFANKKILITEDQNKVEACDIKLLKNLAMTHSKLTAATNFETDVKPAIDLFGKSSPTLNKQVDEVTAFASPEKFASNVTDEFVSKTQENTINGKAVTTEAGKEISFQKSVEGLEQKGNGEIVQTKQHPAAQPLQMDGKQEAKVSNAAPVLNEPLIARSKPETDLKKNSPEVQKISTQNESEKPVVKTLLSDKQSGADIHQQQPAQPEVKDVKHDTAKTSPEVEETKPAEIQQSVSTNHQANEIKNSLPKEKISSGNFQLPETEKTIKLFELSKEISKIIESGTSQKVVLRLLPEALGKVKLTLEVGGEIIHAKAEVENESVRQIIQTNTETLKQTLSQNGLQLASFNVSLAGSDEKQQKAHGQKKRSNSFASKTKIEKSVLPEAARKLGYNTYEYLA